MDLYSKINGTKVLTHLKVELLWTTSTCILWTEWILGVSWMSWRSLAHHQGTSFGLLSFENHPIYMLQDCLEIWTKEWCWGNLFKIMCLVQATMSIKTYRPFFILEAKTTFKNLKIKSATYIFLNRVWFFESYCGFYYTHRHEYI